jgi:hypothetical protein
MNTEEKPICGYGPAANFLTAEGLPISESTLSKEGAPSRGGSLPIEGYWGRRPILRPSRLIAWAKGRVRPRRAAPGDAGSAVVKGPDDRIPRRAPLPLTPEPVHLHTGPANGTANAVKPAPAAASVVPKPEHPPQRVSAAPAATAQPKRPAGAKPRPRSWPRRRAKVAGATSTGTEGERAP